LQSHAFIWFPLLLSSLLLHISAIDQITKLCLACRFFGGGGGGPFSGFPFGGGGGFQEEEEQIPKGNNVFVELEVTLKDLYLGNTFTVLFRSCSSPHITSLLEYRPNIHRREW